MTGLELPIEIEDLAGRILPWARERHPEKFAETMKQAANHDTFYKYMVRLCELRVKEDRQWIRQLPISVLDASNITAEFTGRKSGIRYRFAGRRANDPTAIRFREMAEYSTQDFQLFLASWSAFDLEYAPPEKHP